MCLYICMHADINWNAVRYIQQCEPNRTLETLHTGPLVHLTRLQQPTPLTPAGMSYPTVTHVSFQLMPYPWFPSHQAPLYPG